MSPASDPSILLFDGVCNLCNSLVQFTIRHDRHAKFKFASLQSEYGQAQLKHYGLKQDDFDTFVLIQGDKFFTRSTAALKVLKELGGLWKIMYAFIILPRPLRDAVYNSIAKSRYRLFGKRESCMVPTPELRSRFLG